MLANTAVTGVLAQTGWDGHMWGWGWSTGWWWMGISMVVFWGAIIWIAVVLIGGNQRGRRSQHTPQDQARQVLAERLARGEIDPAEYRERLEALR